MSSDLLKKLQKNEKWIVYGGLLFLFVFFLVLSWISKGTYGGGDDYMHHQIAKFAFRYPEKFLYHWGKPFYTLLIAPFAQLGYFGSKLFNLLVAIFTALLCYRIGKHFGYRNSWILPVFILFTPVYTSMILTGMTEILFSFLLIFSVFLYLKNYSISSAIVISFLPFVRNEAVVIAPIFIVVYLIYKNYKAIPFLLTGYVLYSIVGYFVFNDINWVINQMPYGDASSIYGSGTLFHYVERTKSINGIPLAILFAFGLYSVIYTLIRNKFKLSKSTFLEISLIFLPAIAYYAAHSYVWWMGKGGSLGLVRVMAAIAPLMAIVSLKGMELFVDIFRRYRTMQVVDCIVITFFVVVTPFQVYQIPVPVDDREKVVAEATEWLMSSEYFNRRILYYDSYVAHIGGFDPFDPTRSRMPYGHSISGDVKFDDNDVVIWDAQFGPNEGRMPKEKLLESPYLELVKIFKPQKPFTVLGGYEYEVLVFISKPDSMTGTGSELYEMLSKEFVANTNQELIAAQSFADDSLGYFRISPKMEYSLSQVFTKDKLFNKKKEEANLIVSATILIIDSTSENSQQHNLSLCASLESNGKILNFWSVETKDTDFRPGEWNSLKMNITVPYTRKKDVVLKVFLWNISRSDFGVKDFVVTKYLK